MSKKIALTLLTLAVVVACTLGVGALASPGSVAVAPVVDTSACPATGCASGVCHGFDNVPVPDGVSEMLCPEATCASTECHAWDTLVGRYHQASDVSMNLWILFPVMFVVGLVLLVRKLK